MCSGAAVNLPFGFRPFPFPPASPFYVSPWRILGKYSLKTHSISKGLIVEELTADPPPTSPAYSSQAASSDDNLWRRPPSLGHLSPWCVTIFKDEWPGKRRKHIEVQTLPGTNGSHHRKKASFSFLSRPGALCWKDNAYFIDSRGERWRGRAENNWNQDIKRMFLMEK